MNEMLSSGIELMLIGMGMVYAFLALLVVSINVMTKLVRRFFPETPVNFPEQPVAGGEDKAIIAAISAAMHEYRRKYRKG